MRQIIKWNYDYMDLINTDNQYTFEECNRDGPVDAKYVLSSNPEFVGNPFVEALPKPRRKDSITNGYFMPIPLIDHKELKKCLLSNKKKVC